jgi:hypothetical protein
MQRTVETLVNVAESLLDGIITQQDATMLTDNLREGFALLDRSFSAAKSGDFREAHRLRML